MTPSNATSFTQTVSGLVDGQLISDIKLVEQSNDGCPIITIDSILIVQEDTIIGNISTSSANICEGTQATVIVTGTAGGSYEITGSDTQSGIIPVTGMIEVNVASSLGSNTYDLSMISECAAADTSVSIEVFPAININRITPYTCNAPLTEYTFDISISTSDTPTVDFGSIVSIGTNQWRISGVPDEQIVTVTVNGTNCVAIETFEHDCDCPTIDAPMVTLNPLIFCQGDPIPTAQVMVNGAQADSAEWKDGVVVVQSRLAANPYEYTPTTVSGSLTLQVCAVNLATGCESGPVNVTWTESSGPSVTITTPMSDTIVCDDDSETLTLNANPSGDGPYTFEWSDDGFITTLQTDISVFTSFLDVTSGGTYEVKVTDINGCENTAFLTITEESCVFDCGATTIGLNIDGDTTNSCDDLTASVTSGNGTAPFTFDWSDDNANTFIESGVGVNPDSSTFDTSIYSVGEGRTITLVVTDANGCFTTEVINYTRCNNAFSVDNVDITLGATNGFCDDDPTNFDIFLEDVVRGCVQDIRIDVTVNGGGVNYSITDTIGFASCGNTRTIGDVVTNFSEVTPFTTVSGNNTIQVDVIEVSTGNTIFTQTTNHVCP